MKAQVRLMSRVLTGLMALFVFAVLPAAARTIEISEDDNGKVVKVQPGDQVRITVPGNPTTGYTWQIAAVRIDILEPGLEPEYFADSDRLGSGGRFTFRLKAIGPGYTKVLLAYLRPWETDKPPSKTFEVTADVNAPTEKKPVTTVRYRSVQGKIMTATFDPNTSLVQVTLPDGQKVELPAAVSASGARYTNAYDTFWEHKGLGTYTKGDKVIFEGTIQTGGL